MQADDNVKWIFPNDPRAIAAAEKMVEELKANSQYGLGDGNGTSGKWSMGVAADMELWKRGDNSKVHWLATEFDGKDWDAIFTDVLIPQNSQSEYPMLFRLRDLYEDVLFEDFEVEGLRNECVNAKKMIKSDRGQEGLEKLIRACDLAIASKMALCLDSD
jgi:hypothetical protein